MESWNCYALFSMTEDLQWPISSSAPTMGIQTDSGIPLYEEAWKKLELTISTSDAVLSEISYRERSAVSYSNMWNHASTFWMTVDDSLFLGTWTDKQSSIPYHDVFDAGLDFIGFHSLRSDMSAIVCGDGIREEGLRDDYLELKFYAVLGA
ncbi:hypothetical protein TNCV_1018681 [Trichonephila clavipes]|nr:hypothetical protein TNCV_1018681 [Trichonephila clavipes]